jgi:signal peptidase I
MKIKKELKRFWKFLHEDSWQSWLVAIILIIVLVKGVFFPLMSWITGTSLPLVVVESCSMYHKSSFDKWWESNSNWYDDYGISKNEFDAFSLKNGLNKGDIVLVWGKSDYNIGDIIIFNANAKYPLIHRIISLNPYSTKGDNNPGQLTKNNPPYVDETNIKENQIIGKAVAKIPFLGWIKLIWLEPFRSNGRGFCQELSNQNI